MSEIERRKLSETCPERNRKKAFGEFREQFNNAVDKMWTKVKLDIEHGDNPECTNEGTIIR